MLHYEKSGEHFPIETGAGVQIYRVLQEALNNVSRHSGAKEAWIRLRFEPAELELEVEDHGKGLAPAEGQTGIGLVAMRERAEILGRNACRDGFGSGADERDRHAGEVAHSARKGGNAWRIS